MPETGSAVETALAHAWQDSWPRVIGRLVRETHDLELAEDATQDAFVTAMETWPREGIPANPGGWLMTVARRNVLDRQRRSTTLARKLPLLIVPGEDEPDPVDAWHDDGLRLIFTCCHPTLAPENRVALALRLICGLDTATIARLFLVTETTMAARLTRSRKKIAAAGIAWRVPAPAEMPTRLASLLDTIYLLFTAGHTRPVGDALVDPILLDRSADLARIVAELLPAQPEVLGLHALVTLSNARRHARTDAQGHLVPLEEQDRDRWDRTAIIGGGQTLERSLMLTQGQFPGRFAIQAAIEAVHLEAPTFADTDWLQLLALYSVLDAVAPSPLVKLNRVVVMSHVAGPDAGLAEIDSLDETADAGLAPTLAIARADLLRRAGNPSGAAEAYRTALAAIANDAQREFLAGRLTEMENAITLP